MRLDQVIGTALGYSDRRAEAAANVKQRLQGNGAALRCVLQHLTLDLHRLIGLPHASLELRHLFRSPHAQRVTTQG